MYMFCSLFAICSFYARGGRIGARGKSRLSLPLGTSPSKSRPRPAGGDTGPTCLSARAEIVRLFLAQAQALRDKRKPRPAQEKGNTYLKLISGAGDCGPHIVLPRRLKVSGGWC